MDRPESRFSYYTCSISDSNSTVDDLPGPGRALDNLFGYAGLYLEVFVGKALVKMGKGPIVTAERIRRHRAEIIAMTTSHPLYCTCSDCRIRVEFDLRNESNVIRSATKLKALHKKINKDCKGLVGYIRSSQSLTQKQAVDSVLDLSIWDGELRAMLKGHGANDTITKTAEINRQFRSKNREADIALTDSSRKALVSLGDGEINMLLREWTCMANLQEQQRIYDVSTEMKSLWERISPYLRDTERAFLIMRLLKSSLPSSDSLLSLIFNSIKGAPEYFEWRECEVIMCKFVNAPKYRGDSMEVICSWLFKHADKIPQVFKADGFTWLMKAVFQYPYGSRVFCEWQQSILNGIRRDLEGELSLGALQSRYTSRHAQPFLHELVHPVTEVVRNFLVSHGDPFSEGFPRQEEQNFCNELVHFVNDPDCVMQAKFWDYADRFLEQDIYRCNMLLRALSQTAFNPSEGLEAFMEAKRRRCIPKYNLSEILYYRHFDSRGNIHIEKNIGDCLPDESIGREMIKFPWNWMLKVTMNRGEAFPNTGFFPFIVGYDRHARPNFLAEADLFTFCTEIIGSPRIFIAIKDGMKPEDIRVELRCPHGTVLIIPHEFRVPVLRYAPEAYAKSLGVDTESLFSTGPFSWKSRRVRWIRDPNFKRFQYRVLTIEEARERGYSEEEIYPRTLVQDLPCWNAGTNPVLYDYSDEDTSHDRKGGELGNATGYGEWVSGPGGDESISNSEYNEVSDYEDDCGIPGLDADAEEARNVREGAEGTDVDEWLTTMTIAYQKLVANAYSKNKMV